MAKELTPRRRGRDLFDLDEFFNFPSIGTFFPFESRDIKVDVKDKENELLVEAEIPGFNKEDIEVNIDDNGNLTISAEKREETEEEKEGFIRKERSYGHLERTIPMPYEVDADNANAKYEAGILNIILPKIDTKEKGKRLDIE
ncbi:MAG: Hsp20/alpha crystallin family protein [bacterium]